MTRHLLRRNTALLTLALMVATLPADGRASLPDPVPLQIWASRYEGGHWEGAGSIGSDIALSPDGTRAFVTGSYGGDIATVAYDTASGQQLWVSRYVPPPDEPQPITEGSAELAVSPDGRSLYVLGWETYYGHQLKSLLIAYDTDTGEQSWSTRQYGDAVSAIGLSPDGSRIFAAGGTLVNAYDTAGKLLWRASFEAPDGLVWSAVSLSVGAEGEHLFVTGPASRWEWGSEPVWGGTTVALDQRSGEIVWSKTATDGFWPLALTLGPDGRSLFLTGGMFVGEVDVRAYVTEALDAMTGTTLWRATYEPRLGTNLYVRSYARAIALSPDGSRVYVTGGSYLPSVSVPSIYPRTPASAATLAYDAGTGRQLWVARAALHNGEGADLAVTPDGRHVFVTGKTSDYTSITTPGAPCTACFPDREYLTVGYEANTGLEIWSARYDAGEGDESANGLALSRDGSRLFVTGQSDRSFEDRSFRDFVTFAYCTPGSLVSTPCPALP